MKLVYAITLSSIFAIDIPSGAKSGINALLANTLTSSQHQALLSHGCWCINLDVINAKFKSEGSTTIDDLDSICKKWFQQRACTHLTDGVCFEQDDDSYSFDSTCPTSFPCEQGTCEIDQVFLNLVSDFFTGNFVPTEPSQSECHNGGQGGGDFIEARVCGKTDNLFTTSRVSTDNAISDLLVDLAANPPSWTHSNNLNIPMPSSGSLNQLLGARTPTTVPFSSSRRKRDISDVSFSLADNNWCGNMIKTSRDQGGIRTDWAVSSAMVAADSACIASRGAAYDFLSSMEIANCCEDCRGESADTYGFASRGLEYFVNFGLASGSDSGDELRNGFGEGCYPYVYGSESSDQFDVDGKDGVCHDSCKNGDLKSDHVTGASAEAEVVWLKNRNEVKQHLQSHGPVIMWFQVYKDFFLYKSGIYEKTSSLHNTYSGNHYIKIIGWGEENGVEYWHAINTFGIREMKIKVGLYSSEWYAWSGVKYTCPSGQIVSLKGKCIDKVACNGSNMTSFINGGHYEQGELTPYIESNSCSSTSTSEDNIIEFVNESGRIMFLYEMSDTAALNYINFVNSNGFYRTYKSSNGQVWVTRLDTDYMGIFTIPPGSDYAFWIVMADSNGEMSATEQECNRIINAGEVGLGNLDTMISRKWCKSESIDGSQVLLTIFNKRSTPIIIHSISDTGNTSPTTFVNSGQNTVLDTFSTKKFLITTVTGENISLIGLPDGIGSSAGIEFNDTNRSSRDNNTNGNNAADWV